jgi:hypothetical protein
MDADVASLRVSSGPWRALTTDARLGILANWAANFELGPSEVAALAAGSGLSQPMVRWGASTTAGSLVDGLRPLVDRALARAGVVSAPEVCAHVWASTLPTSGWVPVIGALAVGSAALVRAPAAVLGAAEVLAASLARAHPALGDALRATTWPSGGVQDEAMVALVDGLVVSGGAEAIRRFGRLAVERPRGAIPYVPFGPGFSVAVVPLDAEIDAELAAALAMDVAAYDQFGCLSPQAIWLEDDTAADRLCGELADALSAVERDLPRGVYPVEVAAVVAQQVGTTRVLGRVYEADGAVVLWQPSPLAGARPLYRTIAVYPYSGGPQGLRDAINASDGVRIHSAAVAGGLDVRRRYASALSSLGASRVCAPGTMQTPPATWHHDGMGWLEALLRYADLD